MKKSSTKVIKKSLKPKIKPQRETAESTSKKIQSVSDQFIAKAGMKKHFKK